MKKRKYQAPGVETLPLGVEVMEVIPYSPTPADPEAKGADDVIQDDEVDLSSSVKEIWTDDDEFTKEKQVR